MPLDKDTQESLGLFQGLPIWWRKHQGEISSGGDSSQARAVDSPPPAGPAGRPRGFSNTTRGGGFGGANRLRQNTWRPQNPPARVASASVSSGSGVGGGARQVGQGGRQQVGK